MAENMDQMPQPGFDATRTAASGPSAPPPVYGYPPRDYGAAYPASYPGARPPRSGWFWAAIFGGIVAFILLLFCITFASVVKTLHSDDDAATAFSSSSIGVIDINGVILDAEKIDKQLRRFGDNGNIKAIILHIDSPGGGAAASQEIYHEVLRIRAEKKKPIIASVESVGASGAYYIASGCDKIYANPASVVGSIGVIMEWTNYGELMRWAKLKNITITKGDLKDAGDPSRDLTPKEQAYFQSLVDNMYGQFVHDVATGRHTSDEKIQPLATGQVWTGQQALPLGLIDVQGGFRNAVIETAKQVGISGEPKLIHPPKERRSFLTALTENADDLFPNPSKLLDRAPGFYFMWK